MNQRFKEYQKVQEIKKEIEHESAITNEDIFILNFIKTLILKE